MSLNKFVLLRFAVSRLVGAPPGYVGYEEGILSSMICILQFFVHTPRY